jgi:excisionase family DNA binding protein
MEMAFQCAHFITNRSDRTRRKTVMTDRKNTKAPVGAWLTYREASAYCRLGRTTLTTLVTSGAIPAAKIGKAVRISKTGLEECMLSNAYAEAAQE